MILVFLFGSCKNDKEKSDENAVLDDGLYETLSNEHDISNQPIKKTYEKYGLSDGDIGSFDEKMSNLSIDLEYEDEFNNATTTQEFIEVQDKYIGIWKDEINIALNELLELLPQEDRNAFSDAHTLWEKQIELVALADRKIIDNPENEISLGTSFRWIWLSDLREQYRERYIHIKYMIYLVEGKYKDIG